MFLRSVLVLVGVSSLSAGPVLGADDQFFDSNGVKIHYTVEGKGEPVLLIHGFTANMQLNWVLPGVTRALAKDYQVIAMDCRGHGKSGKPHDPKQYGMEMVEDPVRLLDHLHIKKAHVVGYSMGAMITNKLITTQPERVLTATLGGAAGLPEGSDTQWFLQLADSLDQGKGFGSLIQSLNPAGRPRPTEEQIKNINDFLTASNDIKALAAVLRGWTGLMIPEAKQRANKIPTLALIGELDPLKKGVDELQAKMPGLKVIVITGADHMTAFAHADFSKGLKEFLAKNGQK